MLPSDVALLDLGKILGIVIEEGSLVSHVAIIAKSLGIPAITEVHYAAGLVRSGEHVLLQADAGKVIVNPTAEDVAAHEKQTRRSRGAETSGRKAATAHTPCRTADGEPVTLDANVGSLREVEEALAAGADGIGLLRSEFFYLACQKRPTEEIETAFYRDVLRAMHGRPVTIRLLDLGADKSLPYLHLPKEENPQLGIRGVRMLLHSPELLHHHLRNILQASDTGPVRILVPFVATLRDLDRIQAEIQAICREERVPRQRFRLGIMVELPAVAMDVTPFLPQVDFLSVGTNDLVQYTFAASREDRHLEEYRYAHHPVILRLIHGVAEAARVQGKPVTVCGEMASDPALAPLLVGLGIRTLSMNAGALGAVRARIRKESLPALQQLAREALGASRAEQIPPLLQKPRPAGEPT
jgi:phosphoenolpyruvate-protein phosphotransferase